MGQTEEGAKCPVTRRSRLLVVRCARSPQCSVLSHRRYSFYTPTFNRVTLLRSTMHSHDLVSSDTVHSCEVVVVGLLGSGIRSLVSIGSADNVRVSVILFVDFENNRGL